MTSHRKRRGWLAISPLLLAMLLLVTIPAGAAEKCRPVVEKPFLAEYYETGEVFPQDYAKAAELYRRTAEQGEHTSEYKLGMFYLKGTGVKQDYAEAYYWLNLAGADAMDDAAKHLTPEQIAATDKRANDWRTEFHGRKCSTYTIGTHYEMNKLPQEIKNRREAADGGDAKADRDIAAFYRAGEDYEDAFLYGLLAHALGEAKCDVRPGMADQLDDTARHLGKEAIAHIHQRVDEAEKFSKDQRAQAVNCLKRWAAVQSPPIVLPQ